MKKLFLIRHAESEENVGGYFEDSHIIRLSENGKKQAESLVKILKEPKRIIVSKFLRSQLTAMPLIERYPNIEVLLWAETHEFEPHDNKKSVDLDPKQKKDFFLSYWNKCDPYARETENSENFKELVDRVTNVEKRLKDIPTGVNYIFTHGMFIKIFLFMKNNFPLFVKNREGNYDYEKIMQEFAKFNQKFTTKNIDMYDVTDFFK